MSAKKKPRYDDGYVEKREVLLDGSLPCGPVDAGKPRKTMYFAQVDSPLWFGELRETIEEAIVDGRDYAMSCGLDIPCFRSAS